MQNVFLSMSPTAQVLAAVSILWLAGFIASRATKVLHLPNVTGYILAGVVVGPFALNLVPQNLVDGMGFLTDVALSFIAFGVGRYLRLDRLRQQGPRVIVLTLMEALVTAAVVAVFMITVFHLSVPFSLLLGAIGSATAPASSLMTIRQYHAKGNFVNTLIQVVAMDDAVALLAFSACAAVAAGMESTTTFSWESTLLPLAINLGVLLGAYLLGRLLCVLLQGRSSDHRLVLTCAFIFCIAAFCAAMDVSPLLGCMMLGATYANVSKDKILFKQLNRVTPPINVLFFVLSGMRLDLAALSTVGIIGVSYFAVRIVGKFLGSWLGARMTGCTPEVRRYLGLALIPQAGVSIGLAVLAQRILPEQSGALLSTIILSSSVLYEMIGPVCARKALMLAGVIRQGTEAVKEAPGAAEKAPQPLTQKAAKAPEKPAKAAKGKKQSAPKGKSATVASKKKVALPEGSLPGTHRENQVGRCGATAMGGPPRALLIVPGKRGCFGEKDTPKGIDCQELGSRRGPGGHRGEVGIPPAPLAGGVTLQ